MSLVWHIVRKDICRLWVPLGLWTLVLLAKIQVGVLALAHDGVNLDRWTMLGVANGVLLGLDVLINVVLVAMLVHEDALVGTRMWWVTRPISGNRLLAAKLIGMALMFGALPVVASMPWWLTNHYGAGQLARAVFVTLDWQAMTVLAALLLATLTENPLNFIGWLLGLAAVMAALVMAWSFLFPTETRLDGALGVMATRGLVGAVITLIGFASVIASQFLTRRLVRSLTMLASVAIAGIIVSAGWSWNWMPIKTKSTPGAEAATIEIKQVKLHPPRETDHWVTVDALLRGVSRDLGEAGRVENNWRWADGSAGSNASGMHAGWPGAAEWNALGLPGGKNDAGYLAWRHSGKEQPEEWEPADAVLLRTELYLTTADTMRLRVGKPAYTGYWQITLQRPEREFEIPLHQGAQFAGEKGSVRVAVVDWREGQLSIALIVGDELSDGNGRWRSGLAAFLFALDDRLDDGPRGFALVNRARGAAVKLWPNGQTLQFSVGTQRVAWMRFSCSLPRDSDEPMGHPPRWLDGATLAGVRYSGAGVFAREVKLDHFVREETKEQPR